MRNTNTFLPDWFVVVIVSVINFCALGFLFGQFEFDILTSTLCLIAILVAEMGLLLAYLYGDLDSIRVASVVHQTINIAVWVILVTGIINRVDVDINFFGRVLSTMIVTSGVLIKNEFAYKALFKNREG